MYVKYKNKITTYFLINKFSGNRPQQQAVESHRRIDRLNDSLISLILSLTSPLANLCIAFLILLQITQATSLRATNHRAITHERTVGHLSP